MARRDDKEQHRYFAEEQRSQRGCSGARMQTNFLYGKLADADLTPETSLSTITLAENKADLLASLRRLQGRGTVGDLTADSGLASDNVRVGLKELLETHHGHLDVADSGELLYRFDEKLIQRGTEPLLARLKRTATDVFTKGFKATIVIFLVVYFIIFVALVIAALTANKNSDSRDGGLGGRRGGGGGHRHFGLGNFWLWYYIWTPNWRLGRPYYGHRWESQLPKADRAPFYKKVFAFVFGADKPTPSPQQLDRSKLRLIRARKGVITTAELVEHTGLPFVDAEDEMGRLLGAYDGEAAVSPDSELVYAFPGLMVSAHDSGPAKEPNPAWLRLEPQQELTGNTAGANAIVAGMNAFTLVASATSPWFIFPRLGIGGAAAVVGLVLVPMVFSALFFALPGLRMWGVKRENKRRAKRNIRRVLLGLVYARSLDGDAEVGSAEALEYVKQRLPGTAALAVERALQELASELNADVSVDEAGATGYRFPAIRKQFTASETVRRKLQLENRTLGEVVFSTGDSVNEASERDMRLFDRELKGDEARFDKYLPATDRIGFEDDFELVAFDEELRSRGLAKA